MLTVFLARPGKYFDAIVLVRIVRRGNDDARVELHRPRQVRNRRRRRNADAEDGCSGRSRAMGQFPLDPFTRFARIASNQHTAAQLLAVAKHDFHERGADAANRGGIERIRARGASDAIGSK